AASHPILFSAKYRNLAAENHNRIKETAKAINSPGKRFSFKCSNTPGVYVKYTTTAIPAKLSPIEIKRYLLERYFWWLSCVYEDEFDKNKLVLEGVIFQ